MIAKTRKNDLGTERQELAVIIPAYNESEIIGTVLQDWLEQLRKLEINFSIHVYNDGSKDSTRYVVEQIAESETEVFIHDKKNSGHGPTILKAYAENSNVDWILQIDSDNEISSSYFPKFWELRSDYDFIIGNRDHSNRPKIRKMISTSLKILVGLLFGRGLNDINIPYRLMRTEAFRDFYNTIPEDTFAPNVIVSAFAINRRLRIKQIPVINANRQTGEVSIRKFRLFKVVVKSYFQTVIYKFLK